MGGFFGNKIFEKKEVISIAILRTITGNPKLKSHADGRARSYRRRSLKPLYRQQIGVGLNVVNISYANIFEKWMELEKTKGSGG